MSGGAPLKEIIKEMLEQMNAQTVDIHPIPSRLAELNFRPSLVTAEEMKHIKSCKHCKGMMRATKKKWHPPKETLRLYGQNSLPRQDRDAVHGHIFGFLLIKCTRCHNEANTVE